MGEQDFERDLGWPEAPFYVSILCVAGARETEEYFLLVPTGDHRSFIKKRSLHAGCENLEAISKAICVYRFGLSAFLEKDWLRRSAQGAATDELIEFPIGWESRLLPEVVHSLFETSYQTITHAVSSLYIWVPRRLLQRRCHSCDSPDRLPSH